MTGPFKRDILLLAVGVFLSACGSATTSTALSTAMPPPTATVAAATIAATAELPATALSAAAADPALAATAPPVEDDTNTHQDKPNVVEATRMKIEIGDKVLTATLVENSSVVALKEALAQGPITVDMRDYGSMEKVGSLGMDLPRNDEQITTEAGDIILYQGNAFVIYYAPNSWNFTRLGKVNDVTAGELREILGDGNVTVTLSLPQN